MFDEIKQTPARLRRATSTSTSTRTTCTSRGAVDARHRRGCASSGNIYEKDGAIWLRTEKFGDDKDRVIVKSDGERRLLLRRRRLLPRQAGARLRPLPHHARRRPPRLRRPDDGDVRGVRRRARTQPRDPHRPDGQPAQRRRAGADAQAGRHRRSRSTTWSSAIGVDAARYALARYSHRHHPRHRPRPVGQGRPATTRSTTCSTPTPAPASILRNAADLGLAPGRTPSTPTLLDPREGGRAAAGARRVPAGGRGRRRAARAAPGGALPRGHRRRRTTGSTTPAGCCRWATRSRADLHRARLLLVDATRIVLANGLGLLGVSAPERM